MIQTRAILTPDRHFYRIVCPLCTKAHWLRPVAGRCPAPCDPFTDLDLVPEERWP